MKVSLPAMYMVQPHGLVFFLFISCWKQETSWEWGERQRNVTKDDVFVFKQMEGKKKCMEKYKITICISLCLFMRSVQSYGNAFVVCKFYPNSSYHTTSRMHTKCILNNLQTIFHNKYQITFNVLTSHYTALITYSIHHFTHVELLCSVHTQTTNSFNFTQFTTCHINHLFAI